jgi:hypothetical protein
MILARTPGQHDGVRSLIAAALMQSPSGGNAAPP